ncbi:MAG: hypothetical protein KDH09_02765 [Chrysiogenetes bacterium]|nr:hypothetical protein [Chrysiogenetes bacterium]
MNTRALARDLLEDFAQTRGPLMRNPAWAVMRAIALAMLAQILREARDPNLRVMAAGALETHTGAAPSKRGASKKEWAVASALFADVVRVAVAQVDELTKREALADLLAGDDESDPFERYWKWLPTATIFATLLEGPTIALQLQAARWILSRSRALAERVGYGKPTIPAPPAGELSPKGTEGVPGAAQKKSDRPAATPSAACGGSSPGGGAGRSCVHDRRRDALLGQEKNIWKL